MRLRGDGMQVALTIVVGAGIGALIGGGVGSSASREIEVPARPPSTTVASETATTVPPTSSSPDSEPTRIYIIGDSYTGGSEMNEGPEWPELMNEPD